MNIPCIGGIQWIEKLPHSELITGITPKYISDELSSGKITPNQVRGLMGFEPLTDYTDILYHFKNVEFLFKTMCF